jgi:hypothetical protein
MRSTIDCAGCGQTRRGSVTDPARCERCVGERVRQVCTGCGAEEQNHTAGRCPRCHLNDVLDGVRAGGDPAAIARLEPYLHALGHGPQASTTLKWIARSDAYETVLELASGARPISHAGLDAIDRGMTTAFLRAALVSHGVLDARGEQAAWFERATAGVLANVPAGGDRAHVRSFAVWQVGHDLTRRERRGQTTRRSAANSMRLVRAAAALATWAAAHDLALCDLGQHDLDRWTAQAPTARAASIRPFLAWAARGRLIAPLSAAPRAYRGHAPAMADPDRLALVRRLLHDETLDLRDRVAGCLLICAAAPCQVWA